MLLLALVIHHFLVAVAVGDFVERTEFLTVSEGASVGTRLGRVNITSDLNYRLSTNNDYFDFDVDTGWVFLKTTIDRERINGNGIEILLVSTTPPSILHIFITVTDVNDNNPKFPLPYQNVSLIESSAIGTRVLLLSATDPDAGENGTIVEYAIENDIDQFDLIYNNHGLLYMELKQTLDRERQERFVFNLSARDGGNPSRYGYTTVYVDVIDVNDNAPSFQSDELQTTWNGLASVPIMELHAIDVDYGENGRIVYDIPGTESKYFMIDGNHLYARARN
ncbi:cadherin domain protein [Dictyocaulus viviparus]|uniref:Cadherin domain protein n=1 Tax=Dictyocaulus viviparus TaxID=29172 RepID=A0A0D8XIG6_DICVI|nr:cadherin domain protein [Dictyocaulus viviparus]